MTFEQAISLMENTNTDYTEENAVFDGIVIMMKYGNALVFGCRHEEMFVGYKDKELEDILPTMSDDDVCILSQLGWTIEEDSFRHGTN